MSAAAKAKKTLLGIEIGRDELALRIAIKVIGAHTPAGATPAEALAVMDRINPGMGASMYAAAEAAVLYFHECINAGRQPN